jgi:PAS domain S-box-containing protein
VEGRTPGEESRSGLRQLGLSEGSESLFFSLTARAPVGVFATDADGSCVYVNDRLCELIGLTFEQALGAGWTTALHPDDCDWVRKGWEAALAAGSDFQPEHRFQRPDGTVVWVRGFAAAVRDAENRLTGWIGVCVEDTERRQSEAALRAAKERAEQLIETSNAIVLSVDVDGRVLVFNRTAEEITGYTREEMRKLDWFETLTPRDRYPEVWAEFERLVAGGAPERFKNPILTKSGEERVIAWQNSAVVEEGRIVALVAFGIDVTETVRAEQSALNSLALLETADEERRQLLARIVRAQEEERRRIADDIHDESVQTLTALALRLDVLSGHVQDPGLQEQLAEIQQTARTAITNLRQLMFELHPPILDRDGLAAALRPSLDQLREESGLEVELKDSLGDGPPPEIAAAAYRIVQEALLNVRKHAGARRVGVELAERPGGLYVRVSDDGLGFRTGGRQQPGHLGLVAMRERAEMAGGWFRIDSEPGRGTTVEFMLPPHRLPEA